ncbi:site-specific integrase [Amycolatopsis sp. NPDC051061]|uniref:tyrosine-type recombinase/integrase n=1 Tax=Amycolatopsis sp. NPDC051061 TaxID=3155042 RepID=UPI0034233113
MGRPALPIGTHGKIRTTEESQGRFRARCLYRDFDGKTYEVARFGSTATKAEIRLKEAIRDWVAPVDAKQEVTSETRLTEVGRKWLLELEKDAEKNYKSWGTIDTYRNRFETIVVPAVGELRMREVDNPKVGVPAFDRLCRRVRDESSISSAKTVRAILSGLSAFAVRHGALDANPVREIGRLESKKAKHQRAKPRALTADEAIDLLSKLDTDQVAIADDLPDLARLFLATGERTGEGLAAHWLDFDEERRLLAMAGNVIRAKGRGKVLNRGKTLNADRDIPLPDWCVAMLVQRRATAVSLDGPIFPSSTGTVREASNVRDRAWRPFVARAGYEWVTFRTFRKTVATLLDDAGLTARQIADILGHAHPSMTQDVYMGRGTASRRGADALGSTLGPNQ